MQDSPSTEPAPVPASSFSSLPPPPLFLLLLHHLLHLLVHLLRNYHLCPALSRSASTISSLSATSWLLARALSSFFPLLEGTAFFLVAPAMGGTQNGLYPTNEKRDHGNASPRVLRQWRPSSSTTHRSHPSLSLTIPHRSLALPRRSPALFSHLAVLLSPRAASMLHSSRASFLLRILIFFINFSPSSPDGSPSSSLSLFLFLSVCQSRYSRSRTYVSPPYFAFPVPVRRYLLRVHPRDARPIVLLANDLRIWSPRWGCALAPMSLSLREKRCSFATRPTRFPISRFTFLFPPKCWFFFF